VVLSAGLKPNQQTEVAFNDGVTRFKCMATVVWMAFEMTDAGSRYRAGLDFVDADAAAIDAFAQRHKA